LVVQLEDEEYGSSRRYINFYKLSGFLYD